MIQSSHRKGRHRLSWLSIRWLQVWHRVPWWPPRRYGYFAADGRSLPSWASSFLSTFAFQNQHLWFASQTLDLVAVHVPSVPFRQLDPEFDAHEAGWIDQRHAFWMGCSGQKGYINTTVLPVNFVNFNNKGDQLSQGTHPSLDLRLLGGSFWSSGDVSFMHLAAALTELQRHRASTVLCHRQKPWAFKKILGYQLYF